MGLLENIFNFLRQRLISIILAIIFFEAVILLLLSFYEPRLDTFLQFIAELSGVVFALIIGFEFERFYSGLRFQKEIKKIFLLVKEELSGNRARLIKILDEGFTGVLPWLLQTTTWYIYEERLGEAATENVEDLTRIYHKLNLLNQVILKEHHLIPLGKGPHRQEYRDIGDSAINEIEQWIKKINKFYSLE